MYNNCLKVDERLIKRLSTKVANPQRTSNVVVTTPPLPLDAYHPCNWFVIEKLKS